MDNRFLSAIKGWPQLILLLAALSEMACSKGKSANHHPLECLQGKCIEQGVFDIDAGYVHQERILDVECDLKNNSASPVTLRDRVQTNCSCIGAELEKTKLAPGETTKIHFHLSPKGISGSEAIVQARVFLSQPESNTPLLLQLRYRISAGWICAPIRVALQADDEGWAHGEVQVVAIEGPELRVVSAESTLPESQCVIKPEPAESRKVNNIAASIDVSCRAPFGNGTKDYTVTVHTNDPIVPSRLVQVVLIAHEPIRFEPSILHLTTDAETRVASARIIGNSRVVRLLDATTDNSKVEAAIESSSMNGDIGRLVVRPKESANLQPGIAIVTLRYRVKDAKESLEVTVPVAIGTTNN